MSIHKSAQSIDEHVLIHQLAYVIIVRRAMIILFVQWLPFNASIPLVTIPLIHSRYASANFPLPPVSLRCFFIIAQSFVFLLRSSKLTILINAIWYDNCVPVNFSTVTSTPCTFMLRVWGCARIRRSLRPILRTVLSVKCSFRQQSISLQLTVSIYSVPISMPTVIDQV